MVTAKQAIVAMFLFMTIFLMLILTYEQSADKYKLSRNVFYFNNDTNGTSQLDQAYNLSRQIASTLDQSRSDQSNLDTSVVSAYNIQDTIFDYFEIANKIITIMAISLGIPKWLLLSFTGLIISILVIIITNAILGRVEQ